MKKEMKTLREKHPNWTVPNLLSVIRILVIVPFAIFFLQGGYPVGGVDAGNFRA